MRDFGALKILRENKKQNNNLVPYALDSLVFQLNGSLCIYGENKV